MRLRKKDDEARTEPEPPPTSLPNPTPPAWLPADASYSPSKTGFDLGGVWSYVQSSALGHWVRIQYTEATRELMVSHSHHARRFSLTAGMDPAISLMIAIQEVVSASMLSELLSNHTELLEMKRQIEEQSHVLSRSLNDFQTDTRKYMETMAQQMCDLIDEYVAEAMEDAEA
jgi:hypothetical protein